MKIIEQFSMGKYGDASLCEDALVITPDFIAVIDGATDKSGIRLDGRTTGKFAADNVTDSIQNFAPDLTAHEAIDFICHNFKTALDHYRAKLGLSAIHASAGVTIYSKARREIWRVADGMVMIDGKTDYGVIPCDQVYYDLRALAITHALNEGRTTEEALLADDFTRELLLPLLQKQHLVENHEGLFGYGVINGDAVPRRYIDIFDVKTADEIIIASDGYIELKPTLAETEAHLFSILKEDPLLYKKHRAVKGWLRGQTSFDDRTYVRFKISA
jgi:hypothetical protein